MTTTTSFNEARALSAGKHDTSASAGQANRRFNEARALSAGKRQHAIVEVRQSYASMRPAH